MNPIYSYIDYRQYLHDYYEDAKKRRPHFSYRYFGQRAAIRSPNFLKLVIEGKRNLTRITIEKFVHALNLGEKEGVFFKSLVLFNQAKTATEKQEHYLVLKSMANQVRQQVIGEDHFEYLDKWYTSVVRELICQRDCKDDYEAIGACMHPRITARQARTAIDLLLRLGMVKKRGDGTYEQADPAIATEPQIASLAVRSFNRQMLELATHAVDELPVEHRYASGITMGMAHQCYQVLLAEIDAFKDRIVTIINSYGKEDSVFQLNIQLFPLTGQIPEEKKGRT